MVELEINDDKLNNKFLDIATNGLGTLGHRLLMTALLRFSLIAIGWCLGVWGGRRQMGVNTDTKTGKYTIFYSHVLN